MLAQLSSSAFLIVHCCAALCLLPSAAVLAAASFCGVGDLLVAGAATGVGIGVGSADAGVFHWPVFTQSSSCRVYLRGVFCLLLVHALTILL